MSLCASCGTDRSIGCEHFESTDFAGQQEKIIEVSEAAAGVKVVAPRSTIVGPEKNKYIPAQRDYSARPVAGESQRGPSVVYGARGPEGAPGRDSTVPGPAGRDGRDADVEEVVSLATRTMESRIAKFEGNVGNLLKIALQHAGVIDLNGRAILLPGPQGKPGLSIKGDPGKDGESIVGHAGRNGVDGQSIVGPAGRDGSITEATKAAKEYVQREIADLALGMKEMIIDVLREKKFIDEDGKVIPGEKGATGAVGPRGAQGPIDACLANCTKLIDERLAAFREELRLNS